MEVTNFTDFIPLATRTESRFDINVNPAAFNAVLKLAIASGNIVDMFKKHVAYNKPIDMEKLQSYLNELVNPSNHTDVLQFDINREPIDINTRLVHGIFGIFTESTELMEALFTATENGNNWDGVNVKEELGDIGWYQAILVNELNVDYYSVLQRVIEKLQARYPDKYSDELAINRNLQTERKILEKF